MEDVLQILIMPDFDSTRDSMGYTESDDFNVDEVLFQQGYDGDYTDIADDEVFEIGKGLIGRINSDEDFYLCKKKSDLSHKEDFLIQDDLAPGKYKYSSESHFFFRL